MKKWLSSLWIVGLLTVPAAWADSGGEDAASQKTLIAFSNGDYAEARKDAADGLLKHPDSVKLKLLMGRIATEQEEFPVAEKVFKEVIKADPQNANAYTFLGDLYFRQHNFLPARDNYQKYLELEPRNSDGMMKLVLTEVGRTDLAAAGAAFQKLDQFDKDHPGYYIAKAAIERASGRLPDAEKSLEVARTMYGNQLFPPYLKYYLILFNPPKGQEAAGKAPAAVKAPGKKPN